MELISEYLAADTSPDASADALAIINIGKYFHFVAPSCKLVLARFLA